jgi:hypothetical protein
MANLYQVGGAVCVAPETCTRCGRRPVALLHPCRCVDSQNNRVVGYCRPCADYLAAAAGWQAEHPDEAAELERLQMIAYNAGPYAGDLWERAEAFAREHGHPADPDA